MSKSRQQQRTWRRCKRRHVCTFVLLHFCTLYFCTSAFLDLCLLASPHSCGFAFLHMIVSATKHNWHVRLHVVAMSVVQQAACWALNPWRACCRAFKRAIARWCDILEAIVKVFKSRAVWHYFLESVAARLVCVGAQVPRGLALRPQRSI